MKRELLTDRAVARLKQLAPDDRCEVYDEQLRGFLVRVKTHFGPTTAALI